MDYMVREFPFEYAQAGYASNMLSHSLQTKLTYLIYTRRNPRTTHGAYW